jgi:hypothetical protein
MNWLESINAILFFEYAPTEANPRGQFSSWIILEVWGPSYVVFLNFGDEYLNSLVAKETELKVAVNVPVKHFAGIYTMLQEALTDNKYSVKLKTPGQDNLRSARLEFTPK